MRTLDGSWQQFIANTKASIKVTTATGTFTDVKRILVGQLGLCEAAVAHVNCERPSSYDELLNIVREQLRATNWKDLRELVDATDALYSVLIARQQQRVLPTVQYDALSSLGWLARTVLLLAAGMADKANEASNNTLDCIARVVIVTGHMRSDLWILMQEIGVTQRVG